MMQAYRTMFSPAGPMDMTLTWLVVKLSLDDLLGLLDILSPESGGIPDLRLPVVYPEVDRCFGSTLDDDGVVAGPFHIRHPVAAGFGLGDAAGEGRLGADAETRSAGEGKAAERSHGDDQLVFRAQGVFATLEFIPEIVGYKPGSPHVLPDELVGDRFVRDRVSGKIDSQYLAVIAAHGFPGVYCRLMSRLMSRLTLLNSILTDVRVVVGQGSLQSRVLTTSAVVCRTSWRSRFRLLNLSVPHTTARPSRRGARFRANLRPGMTEAEAAAAAVLGKAGQPIRGERWRALVRGIGCVGHARRRLMSGLKRKRPGNPGLSDMVAGTGFEPVTFGL